MEQNTMSLPRPFSLLVKPTGATCNLDCKYCFFFSEEMLYPGDRFRMSEDLLDTYIRQLRKAHPSGEVNVAWQGGERPLWASISSGAPSYTSKNTESRRRKSFTRYRPTAPS